MPSFCVDCVHKPKVSYLYEDVEVDFLLGNYNVKSGLIDYDVGSRCAVIIIIENVISLTAQLHVSIQNYYEKHTWRLNQVRSSLTIMHFEFEK